MNGHGTRPMLLAVLALGAASLAAANTLTVDAAGGADYLAIGEAVQAAAVGDTVLVAPGIYGGPGNREIDFWGKALVLRAAAGAEATVIDADGDGPVFRLHSGETSACRVEGLTLTGGQATWGGLLNMAGASPAFVDCAFTGGQAVAGAAVYCSGESKAEFLRCRFTSNQASGSGGAVYVNDATPLFTECRFEDNEAADGGAVYCGVVGAAEFVACDFIANRAEKGAALQAFYAEPVIDTCRFFGNTADHGGGLYLINCWPHVEASSFARNSDGIWCQAAEPLIERCVLAFNGAGLVCAAGAAPELVHCCVFGNLGDVPCGEAGEILSADPLFCDLNAGHLDVCANSPCLADNNAWGEPIGSGGIGCGDCAQTPARAISWSQLKCLYR